jgi:polysaccharide pyruvyl transferase WcaK-like protein
VSVVKVYLVNDTSLNMNWGSRAAIYMLRRMIEASGSEVVATLPLQKLAFLDWDAKPSTQRFYTTASKTFSKPQKLSSLAQLLLRQIPPRLPDVAPKTWQEFHACADNVMKRNFLPEVKRALEACDVVMIHGEGGIFGNQRESRMMLFIAYLAKQCFYKPVALVNQTTDLSHPGLYEMAKNVYPMLDEIVFREPTSAQVCKAFSSAFVAADTGFAFEPSPHKAWAEVASQPGYFHIYPQITGEFNPKEPYICVGGSSIYYRKDRPNYDPVAGFTTLCERLLEQSQVVLTASAQADLPIFEPIARKLNLPLIRPETSAQQAVDLLAHSTAYIGGRWHSSIFAFLGGAPVVPLGAHTFKVHSLFKQMNIDVQPFEAMDLERETDGIVSLLNNYLAQGHSLRHTFRDRARELGEQAWDNVRFLGGQHLEGKAKAKAA